MKLFLFFIICFWSVSQAFGQSNTNSNIQFNEPVNGNAEEEKKNLEVPVPQTMPQLKEEQQHVKYKVEKSSPVSKKASTPASAEGSSVMFSSSRKTASTQMTSRSPSPMQQQEMNQAISFYKVNAPESFEYHYFTYAAGNYNVSLFPHLKKAEEMKPANSDVIAQVAAYSIITGDSIQAEKSLSRLVEIGKIEQEVLAYDTDLLNSVPANGVLLTHGFDDGYGSFYLNSVANLRTDVKIISLDFMQSKVYRDSLQKDGFRMPASATVDVQFLSEFCQKNESKNLYLSMTFPKPYLTALADKLSVHGLTFAYGAGKANTFENNEALWQKIVQAGSVNRFKTEKGKQLSANYLPLLFYLRERYEADDPARLKDIDAAIDKIGVQSNKFSKVNSIRGLK